MKLLVIGCNHHTAPLGLRERLAFDPPTCREALTGYRAEFPEAEAVLLSTCNRTELYMARPLHWRPRGEEAARWLAARRGLTGGELAPALYQHADGEAARHLFRVVAGLDSMVLGESQIVQQIRLALETARAAGSAGPSLGGLFEKALAAGRDVRQRSGIGGGRFSLGSVAADLAGEVFPRFDDKTVLMLGAGRMGAITLRHLISRGPGRVWLSSRNEARAARLAGRLGAEVRPFGRLAECVGDSDVVVSCVASKRPLLTRGDWTALRGRGAGRPMLFVDLGVPRNIDPAVGDCEGVALYNIDHLEVLAAADRQGRQAAAEQAERLIGMHVAAYLHERARRESGPIVAALRTHLETLALREYAWLERRRAANPSQCDELTRQFVHRLIAKMLHTPTSALQRLSEEGKAEAYEQMLRKLFELDRR